MPDKLNPVIPAENARAESSYDTLRAEKLRKQSEREDLKPLKLGNTNKYANIFKVGDRTRHELSFAHSNEHGGSGGSLDLAEVIPPEALTDFVQAAKHAQVIHAMESVDGMREVEVLDENEVEALRQLESKRQGAPGEDRAFYEWGAMGPQDGDKRSE